ncbi:type I methionyl aminopeptidase [Pelagibacterium halotolerans]|uniref:Methionine aminopeptidase n=1 Tax=Pelagibacterium halotolerans (strain DSM 22347 / JCM 15775 / CGMCC 1.7692 / B2) TaxID=1082931 RepID=G4R9Q4_PELHB|nr:type I methionyl aminopeptidase [Pelagibacterium halotolerans]AEQ51461.1 methionine aminopeptidase [Pelagibacterium halotolerans B2]QJR18698.1 type I methionyl aminopeptidase [Pelagibacterium halotolerans]SEA14175.1 methionine aminopeptidase, type I [Pelagibacterium halotolerans]
MTITSEEELERLKAIGRICAIARDTMASALEPGMTTRELDDIGRKVLDDHGARSAPEVTYQFPGATCISVNEEVAHGIPGSRVINAGDLVNIDVSAEKDGIFADTGASYIVPPGATRRLEKLCSDGKKAMWSGIRAVRTGGRMADIGDAIGKFAGTNGYTLIRNLASHGIGHGLHDEPGEIPTWPDRSERRRIGEGLVFTVEPFLSLGGRMAEEKSMDDPWTLVSVPPAPCVQYEHTIVATRRGAVVVTLAA